MDKNINQPKRAFEPITRSKWHKALLLPKLVPVGSKFRLKFYVLDSTIKTTENIATNFMLSKPLIDDLLGQPFEQCSHSKFLVYVEDNPFNTKYPTITEIKEFPDDEEKPFYETWFKELSEEWQGCLNSDNPSEIKRKYLEDRKKNDPVYCRALEVRKTTNLLLAGKGTDDQCKRFFGAELDTVRTHIQQQFKDDMTWQNRGSVWHLDHIKPLASFNLFKTLELLSAVHYTNYQPLYAKENLEKWAN